MKSYSRATKGELRVDRFLIPYRIYGDKGDHIVCLNGVQQSMAMWQSFVSRFSNQYRIVLFDFPNQGKGKVLSGAATVTLDEQVNILKTLLETTKSNKNLTLCTASWGGVVWLS